jgi:Calcineurin-like phosphoesterase
MDNNAPARSTSDYIGLSRSVAQNHFRTEQTKREVRKPINKIRQFITTTLWLWLYHYIKSRFGPKHDYPTYSAGDDTGIYRIEEGDVIGIVSDWATDTAESCQIASRMQDAIPQYTIHMGDTYFVGEPKEIAANFLKEDCPWVRGSKGSFALLGNHEMYARGISFFDDLLPTLGICKNGTFQKQKAGFFCLENDHWRILGLDTGYHSIGKIPILEMIPFLSPNCRLDDKLMAWLKDLVRLDDGSDRRGLVILTHHQYVTAFKGEGEYRKPAAQLASLIGTEREALWIWGHEHKFSMFEKVRVREGITAYGRCIGHGGMPIELSTKTFTMDASKNGFPRLVMVDQRPKPDLRDMGYNGYVILRTEGADLRIQYLDAEQVLIEENWHHEAASGKISGTLKTAAPVLQPIEGKRWEDLYK